MPTVDEIINNATAGLGDDLKPDENAPPKPEANKPAEPKEVEHEEENKKPEAKPEVKPDEKSEDEFTAKEVEQPKEDAPTAVVETPTVDTSGLSDEAKFIVDGLPFMTARIKDGDNVKELQVKSWTQLPEDVTFATKRDELAFMNALTAQENRATGLQNQYRLNQTTEQNKKFEKLEDDSVWDDIDELQKEGSIAKFTGPKDNPTFKTDADAERVEAVMDYMRDQNKLYLDMYNQGRPYRHIGFKEAFALYENKNPRTTPTQKKEDQNREEVAEHLNVNRGLTPKEFKRPVIKPGTRLQDILSRIDSQEEL